MIQLSGCHLASINPLGLPYNNPQCNWGQSDQQQPQPRSGLLKKVRELGRWFCLKSGK